MTSQPNSPSFGTWGNAFASFVLGAANTASAYIPVTTGLRQIRYSMFAQDEWRATPKLTLSFGIRWDYMPMYNEVNSKMSSFQPNITNSAAGGRLGGLGFAGSGTGRVGDNFVSNFKKAFGPRLGVSYQVTPKTVVRVSSGLYYANWGPSQQNPYSAGFSSSPSFSSPDGFTPVMDIGPSGSGLFPQDFKRPPLLDPTFVNGQAVQFYSRDGSRPPQTINWNFSLSGS